MGRVAEREREKVLQKVRAYLARAATDHSLELSYDAIAAGANVSRSHFSKTGEPDIAQLVSEIQIVRAERAGTPITDLPAGVGGETASRNSRTAEVEGLSDQALAADVRRTIQEVARHMQVWLGHHRALASVEEAPLALYDLDRALKSLCRDREHLTVLLAERDRRVKRVGANTQFNLPIAPTEPNRPGR